jgi:hypothetical protein
MTYYMLVSRIGFVKIKLSRELPDITKSFFRGIYSEQEVEEFKNGTTSV